MYFWGDKNFKLLCEKVRKERVFFERENKGYLEMLLKCFLNFLVCFKLFV